MFGNGLHGGPVGIIVVIALFAVRMLMRYSRGGGGRRRPPRNGPWNM